jgi:hypothetical protein
MGKNVEKNGKNRNLNFHGPAKTIAGVCRGTNGETG